MNSPQEAPIVQKSNLLAITSMILGIFSLIGASVVTGIPAIVVGIIALKRPGGRAMSISGIIMGSVSVLLLAVLAILFFFFIDFLKYFIEQVNVK